MRKISFILLVVTFMLNFCTQKDKSHAKNTEKKVVKKQTVQKGQGTSLLGKPLVPGKAPEKLVKQYEEAKAKYEAAPDVIENIIWYGRRKAYLGDYIKAIDIFTEGIKKYPEEPRFYRHRGHRYISIRKFKEAIEDFKKAKELTAGKEDTIEPDGMPNTQNIPLTTLKGNIAYHLGLAYYLTNDLENAINTYKERLILARNDDNKVSLLHWYYMALRRLDRNEDAKKILEPVHKDMEIIENMAYHQLCLFYKGVIKLEDFTGSKYTSIMNDAARYGIANWYLYNNQKDEAKEVFEKLLAGKGWASFGYIAAEADYVRYFKGEAK